MKKRTDAIMQVINQQLQAAGPNASVEEKAEIIRGSLQVQIAEMAPAATESFLGSLNQSAIINKGVDYATKKLISGVIREGAGDAFDNTLSAEKIDNIKKDMLPSYPRRPSVVDAPLPNKLQHRDSLVVMQELAQKPVVARKDSIPDEAAVNKAGGKKVTFGKKGALEI